MLKNAINALSQAIIGLSKDMDVLAGNGDIVYVYQAGGNRGRAYLIFLMATAIQYLCGDKRC